MAFDSSGGTTEPDAGGHLSETFLSRCRQVLLFRHTRWPAQQRQRRPPASALRGPQTAVQPQTAQRQAVRQQTAQRQAAQQRAAAWPRLKAAPLPRRHSSPLLREHQMPPPPWTAAATARRWEPWATCLTRAASRGLCRARLWTWFYRMTTSATRTAQVGDLQGLPGMSADLKAGFVALLKLISQRGDIVRSMHCGHSLCGMFRMPIPAGTRE